MLSITKTTQFLLFLLLFSPLFSYISFGILGLESITFYFKFVFCFYGCFFVYKKWKVIHFSALHYFWICYILYIIIWSFYNGIYERSGFLTNKNLIYISTLFIIIIIYNTNFEERFIKNSILIIKITVIVAAIVSLIQFYNSSFLDANLYGTSGEVLKVLLQELFTKLEDLLYLVMLIKMKLAYLICLFYLY